MRLLRIEETKLIFDDGTTLEAYHSQDCCESVYADFSQLQDTDFYNQVFEKLVIEGVLESGFRINGYFVPCYNSQNGYYSSDLGLILTDKNGHVTEQDISDWVRDDID